MEKVIVAEGKTTNEAIENGLKELNVSRDKVEVKVLENKDKRSFFSILAPRVVTVELTLKEKSTKTSKAAENHNEETKNIKEKVEKDIPVEVLEASKECVDNFVSTFLKETMKDEKYSYETKIEKNCILVNINGENTGFLIGYRGDTLNAIQTLLISIANKNLNYKVRVLLDIEGYRTKREKTLENLAEKIAKTVMKTGKPVTLEPMSAYERKIIHSKLQNNNKVTTNSIGEEPYRKVVISKK